MSPNGCCLRCHITTQDRIYVNREVDLDGASYEVWHTSTGAMTTGEDMKPLVKTFMDGNPQLLEIGKGEDPEYVEWFCKLMSLAAKG